jgi:hypothetical protein
MASMAISIINENNVKIINNGINAMAASAVAK